MMNRRSRCLRFVLAAVTLLALVASALSALADETPQYDKIADGQYMKEWLLLGPIGQAEGEKAEAALAKDYLSGAGGETKIAARRGQAQQVEGQALEWQRVQSKTDIVDLDALLGEHDHAIAYAYAEITLDESRRFVFGIGSDDAVKVWLNGKPVHENSVGRPVRPDEDLIQLSLDKGTNRLLLKVQNYTLNWGFSCRALDDAALASRLARAAGRGDRDQLDRLLEWGVSINAGDARGLTALHAARILGQREVAEYLIQRGADPQIELPSWESVADKVLSEAVPENSPGVAVLAARDGEITFKSGYGFASLAHRAQVTPQTKFRIGSVSKQFTAAAILKLQEQGKLSVDDTLDKFFPDYPRGDEVTLRHMLTHTSGIHSYTEKPGFMNTVQSFIAPEQLIESFKNDPYDFDPGKGWHYSNSGYFLLGEIVAKVSGQSYADYLKSQFFQPLGMTSSGVHQWSEVLEDEATGYSWSDGEVSKAMDWDMSQAGGAGAIYSTVEDLFRWNEAIFGGQVLNEKTLEEAFTPVPIPENASPVGMPYGFGWIISEQRGLQTIGHGGGLHGFVSHLVRYPEHNLTVVALVNASPPPPDLSPNEITSEIAQLILWQEMETVKSYEVDESVDPAVYDDYVGQYDYLTGIMTVTRDGKRLFAQITGQPNWEIFPKSEAEFFWKVVDAQVTFVKNDEGQVTHAMHRQGGQQFRAARIEARKTVEVDTDLLDDYVGKYDYGGRIAVLTVTRDGQRLFAQMTGQPRFEIFPKSKSQFFWKVVNAEVEFVRDEEGKVAKAVHQQAGQTIEAPKFE